MPTRGPHDQLHQQRVCVKLDVPLAGRGPVAGLLNDVDKIRHASNSSYSQTMGPRSDVTAPTRCSRGRTVTPPWVRKRVGSCMRSSMGTMT